MLTKILCNHKVMQEKKKKKLSWDVKKPLKKNRNKIKFTPLKRLLCSCGQNIMVFLQPSPLFQNKWFDHKFI